MKKFFGEFKSFITKGNIIDIAVAFILGVSFKAIISSLVNDVFMPVLSLVFGSEGFTNYKHIITPAITDADGVVVQVENAIYWGKFVQAGFDFVLVGFILFLIVRAINKATAKAEEKKNALNAEIEAAKPIAEPKPTVEELLGDIKNLLKEKK